MAPTSTLSRRTVLVLSASAVGAAVLTGPLGSVAGAASASSSRAGVVAATGLRRSHWTRLVGRTVTVAGPQGNQTVTVVGVEDLAGSPKGAATSFSVELRTAKTRRDVSGLRSVTIPGQGVATLLLTSVDRGVAFRTYQVVVNTNQ